MKKQVIDLRDAVGNPRGRNSDKNHRVAKLMKEWDDLKAKLANMVRRGGGKSETARLAYATLLIMETGIRVGNEESAEGFISVGQRVKDGKIVWQSETHGKLCKTYGLTTLTVDHVTILKGELRLAFVGKKHVEQNLTTTNRVLVDCAPTRNRNPGELWLGVTDARLRKFVKRYVGKCFTPKDIRRAYVNILFCDNFGEDFFLDYHTAAKKSDRNRVVKACVEKTAATVGHTPGVCRSAYLSHPMLNVLKTWTPE